MHAEPSSVSWAIVAFPLGPGDPWRYPPSQLLTLFRISPCGFTMRPLECIPSRVKIAGLLVLTAVMVGVSWFCTTLDRIVPTIAGWFGVAFFSLGFIALPRAWLRARTPTIIIGPNGIEDRQSGYGFIPWQDVTELVVHSIKGTKMLSIHVANDDQ